MASNVSHSPPRAPPIRYSAPLGTRWAKETAAAGGVGAFDLPTDPKNIGPWILGECVGKGASGRVKIAKHRHTGQLAAVKILPIAPLVTSRASLATQQAKSDKQRLGIDREITMMKLMNHSNIIRIYDVFESDKDLFLVLEYVEGGELFDFLVNRGRLPPAEALAYFKQIVYGLNYAHTFSIIHRDLKPENILIANISPPLIKIADWGMAAFAPPSLQLETSCGSPHYASPEIVNGQKYQGNATDIWSCGVILYALLTGRLPFDDKNVKVLLSKVKSGKYDMPSWIDPLAKDLLSRMLVVDVNKRITIPEIMDHAWFCSPSVSLSAEHEAIDCVSQLPPSPSTLARPIASPSLVDPELLASLRVIWGRHTDPNGESIKKDLCSPAGQGVYAKAFYFLLGKYREESRKHYDNEGKDDTHSLSSSHRESYDSSGDVFASEHPSCHPPSVVSGVTSDRVPPLMNRGATSSSSGSRERGAPSPAGPRPPPSQISGRNAMEILREKSETLDAKLSRFSINSPRPPTSSLLARRGPRSSVTQRGYTYSHPNKDISTIQFPRLSPDDDRLNQEPTRRTGIPRSPRLGRPKSSMFTSPPDPSLLLARRAKSTALSSTSVSTQKPNLITPKLPSRHQFGDSVATELGHDPSTYSREGLSTSREAGDTQAVSTAVEAVAKSITASPVGGSLARGGSRVNVLERGPASGPRERVVSRSNVSEDKENQSLDDNWSYVTVEDARIRGLGLRDVGRNMGNIMALRDGGMGVKGKKEKRTRPPTLDFRSISNQQKRTTLVGSPPTLSSPSNVSAASNRILTSPVVGEFRGWFSNLFNWRSSSSGQGGVLYSADNISQTCTEMTKILEGLGIIVETAESERGKEKGSVGFSDGPGSLKCRVDEANNSAWTIAKGLKPVRFRLEFSGPTRNAESGVSVGCGMGGAASTQHSSYLTPPTQSYYHQGGLSLTSATATSSISGSGNASKKARSSILMSSSRRSSATVTPSPLIDGGGGAAEFPPGTECAIAMVYEKGSVSSFRTVWRKLKELYGVGAEGPVALTSCLSPAIATTPLAEHTERLIT